MATFTHAQLENLWSLAGGLPQWADTAAAIAQAESAGCQYAQRGPIDIRPVKQCVYVNDPVRYVIGLWQINQAAHPTYSRTELFNPSYNANAAVAISKGGADFGPWTTYTSGAYKQFLTSGGLPGPQPGTTPSLTAAAGTASGLHGYADLRQSVAHHLNRDLYKARTVSDAAYRLLARHGKAKR